MIINLPSVANFISGWIKDYCDNHGIENVYCNMQSGNDYVLYKLAINTGLSVQRYIHGEDESVEDMHDINCPNIFLSSLDYTYSKYTRQYYKPFEGMMDLYPLKGLLYSEVRQLEEHLLNAVQPKNKDWEMQEWAIHLELSFPGPDGNGMITSEETPTKHPRWCALTLEQKKFVAALHQREKVTRHKIIDKPYPKIPSNMLCREEFPVPLQ